MPPWQLDFLVLRARKHEAHVRCPLLLWLAIVSPGDLLMSDVRYVVLDEADTLLCDNFVDDVKALMVPLRVRALKTQGMVWGQGLWPGAGEEEKGAGGGGKEGVWEGGREHGKRPYPCHPLGTSAQRCVVCFVRLAGECD